MRFYAPEVTNEPSFNTLRGIVDAPLTPHKIEYDTAWSPVKSPVFVPLVNVINLKSAAILS